MKDSKAKYEEDWEKINNFLQIYPDLFDPQKCNQELYLWALSVLHQRAFGWGLPSVMLIPMADCVNHTNKGFLGIEILEKNLHKSMNKIYLYKHNFEEIKEDDDNVDKIYDKSSSKLSIACQKLFAEDEIATLPEEVRNSWTG